MALNQTSKITLTTFEPKRLLGIEDKAVTQLLLGALVGHATGTVNRKSPDGSQTFTGLAGAFEARLVDGAGVLRDKDSLGSGVLFMPDSFQEGILAALSDKVDGDGKVTEPGAEAVNFAFQVFVKRAGNPQGYEWMLQPLVEVAPDQYDPLAEMRAALPPVFQPQVAIAGPAPTEAPAKGKK